VEILVEKKEAKKKKNGKGERSNKMEERRSVSC
jgi:hypothetical protein